ncbi:hypothetical protein CBL_10467 [Carabus blaptoides fortunei]
MSSVFKHGIVERVPAVYTFAKASHVDLGPDGYKIAITALLGFTPTDWETDEVFRQRTGLSLAELHDIVNYKLRFLHVEQYLGDVFTKLDSNFKGYITLQDIRAVWEQVSSDCSWSKIQECFRELSKGNVMDYSKFFEILSSDADNHDVNLNMYSDLFNQI